MTFGQLQLLRVYMDGCRCAKEEEIWEGGGGEEIEGGERRGKMED